VVKIEDIIHLSSHRKLLEFAKFILSNSERNKLPDYPSLNLMTIPSLVPHIFVLDVLNSKDKLQVKYCGTVIDSFYGINMTGKCIYDYYKGEETFDDVENIFRQCIQAKLPSYTRRGIHLENERVNKFKIAETIMFPCSSGDGTVNYTIGFSDYYQVSDLGEQYITLIKPVTP
jgi:hypothetical protein